MGKDKLWAEPISAGVRYSGSRSKCRSICPSYLPSLPDLPDLPDQSDLPDQTRRNGTCLRKWTVKPTNRFAAVLETSRKRIAGRSPPLDDDDVTPPSSTDLPNFSWATFRLEGPRSASEPETVRPPLRVGPHQRVLIGSGTSHGQARIQIGAGPLAGSEIRLALVGNHVDAQLLTRNEGSRQTLLVAMDAVRDKLRTRGLAFRSAPRAAARQGWDRSTEPRHEERLPTSHEEA